MSKPKPRPSSNARRIRPSDRLDLIDDAAASCRAVGALAQLLERAGTACDLEGVLAAETGCLIAYHAKKLRETFEKLEVILAKSQDGFDP